jgi:N-acetylmuramoyl-L-alanine amidase
MKVLRHRVHTLDGDSLPYEASPNRGGALTPRFLVMHYTAGASARQSIDWLTNRDARASAHVVIARDGAITQLVPFDRVAWHAGRSRWEGIEGLNQHSIGIELDNAGRLMRQGDKWRAWFGQTYEDDEVMEATHKHETSPAGWHVFTPQQIDAALELASVLVRKYDLVDVLGHDDISPFRKSDPGPAFPMESFRARLLGRTEDLAPRYATTVNLNIRTGPGTEYDRLPASPLPPGTEVEVLEALGRWRLVDVLEPVQGEADVEGWVHGAFLHRVSTP